LIDESGEKSLVLLASINNYNHLEKYNYVQKKTRSANRINYPLYDLFVPFTETTIALAYMVLNKETLPSEADA